MSFRIADFPLERAVFELRFDEAFMLWDRAGTIWQSLRKTFPDVRLAQSPRPNVQSIRLNKTTVVECRLDRLNIQGFHISNHVEDFGVVCEAVSKQVIRDLEITDLNRIGFRTYFQKEFKDKETALGASLDVVPLCKRSGKFFNIEDGSIHDPLVALRWEGATTGCHVRIQPAEQKLEMEVPLEFSGDEIKPPKERHLVVVDVDYYVHAITAVSKFNAKALIENWARLVRRDLEGFVNV